MFQKILTSFSVTFLIILSTSLSNAQIPVLQIWELQGSGITSPWQNFSVSTQNNIITGVGLNVFFIQTPDDRVDQDSLTSNGITVQVVGSMPNLSIGMEVSVTGLIREINGNTVIRVSSNDIVIESSNNTLPRAVIFDENFPSTTPKAVPDLERVEGMIVQFDAIICGPNLGGEVVPITTQKSRPFREPGIIFPGLNNLPVWDGNPEVFLFEPAGLNAPNNRFLNAEMTVSATAIITQFLDIYLSYPTTYELFGSSKIQSVRNKEENELTIGSLNTLLLFPDEEDYRARIQKLARYILQILQAPAILALQEVGGTVVLDDLAAEISRQDNNQHYQSFLIPGNGNLQLGYLVESTLQVKSVTQLGKNDFLSIGGVLHDRPPLLLEVALSTAPETVLKVLNVHLRSLIGIEGNNANFVRQKRFEQSVSVAQMVQARREDNLVIVGDFNAFEFSDGYVDVVNQIAGQPSLGAQFQPSNIVQPALINQVLSLPEEERYSFVFQGNAQLLDQCLSTELMDFDIKGFEFGRANADNSIAYASNEFLLERTSDHDGFVLFLEPKNTIVSSNNFSKKNTIELIYSNPMSQDRKISFMIHPQSNSQFKLINLQGQVILQQAFDFNQMEAIIPATIPPGIYFISVETEKESTLEKLVIH